MGVGGSAQRPWWRSGTAKAGAWGGVAQPQGPGLPRAGLRVLTLGPQITALTAQISVGCKVSGPLLP